MSEDEVSLATRAAWLSYVGGYTQGEIADRVGVSRVKVHRLISLAHQLGRVKVFVEGEPADCIAYEDALMKRFDLNTCVVVPKIEVKGATNTHDQFASIGVAGAGYLHRLLDARDGPETIGVGHGRTLAAVANHLPSVPRPDLKVVSLIGSLTRKASTNPFDVVHLLANKTGGEGYFMPVPFVADSTADAAVLMAQKSVRDVFERARDAALVMIGIGELGGEAHMRVSGMITDQEYAELRSLGAVGDVIGHFVDAHGRPVASEVNERTLGLRIDDLRGKEVIAVAGGAEKGDAILAALRGGILTGLITDDAAARAIVAADGTTAAAMPKV